MKVTIKNETKSSEIKYPCLRQSPFGEIVILFISPKCGTVMHGHNLGVHCDNWDDAKNWKLFTGTVELSND